ncbi:MAG TPA: hypothetical protein VGC42_16565 [Kofleriaceae bacterium]
MGDRAELSDGDVTLGTFDMAAGEIDLKVGLGEAAGVAQRKRFPPDGYACSVQGGDLRRREITAIDLELVELPVLTRDVREKVVRGRCLGAIGWVIATATITLLVRSRAT